MARYVWKETEYFFTCNKKNKFILDSKQTNFRNILFILQKKKNVMETQLLTGTGCSTGNIDMFTVSCSLWAKCLNKWQNRKQHVNTIMKMQLESISCCWAQWEDLAGWRQGEKKDSLKTVSEAMLKSIGYFAKFFVWGQKTKVVAGGGHACSANSERLVFLWCGNKINLGARFFLAELASASCRFNWKETNTQNLEEQKIKTNFLHKLKLIN